MNIDFRQRDWFEVKERDEFLAALVRCCGFGKVLCVGNPAGKLLRQLRGLGIEASTSDLKTVLNIPTGLQGSGESQSQVDSQKDDACVNTLLCIGELDELPEGDVSYALAQFLKHTRNYAVLMVSNSAPNGRLRDRKWWETKCFEAGFRIHPRSFAVLPYEAREKNGHLVTLWLEKVPAAALIQFPLDVLTDNRLLHMDMLRETGRRGDAHCVRYHYASQFVRPGDVVLDVACGLGYGSHIVYNNSHAILLLGVDLSGFGVSYAMANYALPGCVEFKIGDAQSLSFVADNSIDFITSFETIEHVSDPQELLAEIRRVLKPAGRLMISAPNDWTDKTGHDPNPHHLHVYNWQRLKEECGELFIIERGFVQTAGGAMKCHHSPRVWHEVPVQGGLEEDVEWIILLCMVDPLAGKQIAYTETTWRIPNIQDFHVAAYGRDYKNPWLAKGMVIMGMRNENRHELVSMQRRVLHTEAEDSVDYGAALCGLAYSLLEQSDVDDGEYEELSRRIRRYADAPTVTPHQLRWQISVLFAGAEIARVMGRWEEAIVMYQECADREVSSFSPLLGNKTLDALYWVAILSLNGKDTARAKESLLRSVRIAKLLSSESWLNVCGSLEEPLAFGLAEMAQLFDKASRAAYLLNVLSEWQRRSGLVAEEAKGFYERLLYWKTTDFAEAQKGIKTLTEEVIRLNSRCVELGNLVQEKEAIAQSLGNEVITQDRHAQDLARQIAATDAQAQKLAQQVQQLVGECQKKNEELEKALADLVVAKKELSDQLNESRLLNIWKQLLRRR